MVALAFPTINYAQISNQLSLGKAAVNVNVLVPGLFQLDEVAAIVTATRCSLPASSELIDWAKNKAEQKSKVWGFYWMAPNSSEFGFASYMHLPSTKIVDFGNNFFQGYLLLTCDKDFNAPALS